MEITQKTFTVNFFGVRAAEKFHFLRDVFAVYFQKCKITKNLQHKIYKKFTRRC